MDDFSFGSLKCTVTAFFGPALSLSSELALLNSSLSALFMVCNGHNVTLGIASIMFQSSHEHYAVVAFIDDSSKN